MQDKRSMTATLRQQIIELLADGELTAIDLSKGLGIREREVYDHLPHISRSLSVQGKRLAVRPAQCLSCGYVFGNRTRLSRPGRCPECRSTHLQSPAYSIRRRT